MLIGQRGLLVRPYTSATVSEVKRHPLVHHPWIPEVQ